MRRVEIEKNLYTCMHDYPKLDDLTKRDILQDIMQKRQINNMSTYYHNLSVFYKQLIPLLIDVCKLLLIGNVCTY